MLTEATPGDRRRGLCVTMKHYTQRLLATATALVIVVWSSSSAPTATATAAQLTAGSVVHNPLAIATALSLGRKDLPAGWTSDGQAARCIAGKGSNPAVPYCGATPIPGEQASDQAFARCVGVPLAQASMLVGQDEPGEPFTYSSSTFTAPGSPSANPDLLPQAQTYLSIERSSAVESSDLKAFSKAGFPTCFKIAETGPLFDIIKGFAHALHGQFSVGPLLRVAIPSTIGVSSIGYYVVMKLRANTFAGSQTLCLVVMGASYIEEVLVLHSLSNSPLPVRVRGNIVTNLELGLARFASAA